MLCDGKTWGFYLPGVQGSYEERRVYKLDLMERAPQESAEKLIRFLEFDRTKLGQALADAKSDHQDQNRRALSKQTIPKAWKELIEGEDPSIVEKIASEVEGKCGVRPVVDDVMEFLSGLGVPTLSPAPAPAPQTPPPPIFRGTHQLQRQPATTVPQTQRGFQLHETFFPCRTGVEVMIRILSKLSESDPDFPAKCHLHQDNMVPSGHTSHAALPSCILSDQIWRNSRSSLPLGGMWQQTFQIR